MKGDAGGAKQRGVKKARGVGGGAAPARAAASVAAVAPGGVHVEAAVESRDGGKGRTRAQEST